MPDLPNIQAEVLEYVLSKADGPHDVVNLRPFARENDYSERRVARKAGETGVLSCGINMLHPWYEKEVEARERLQELRGE
jgi:hypothetical protein